MTKCQSVTNGGKQKLKQKFFNDSYQMSTVANHHQPFSSMRPKKKRKNTWKYYYYPIIPYTWL